MDDRAATQLFLEQVIEVQRGGCFVSLDVVVNVVAILYRLQRPEQLYHVDASSRLRVAARRAANLASISTAGTITVVGGGS